MDEHESLSKMFKNIKLEDEEFIICSTEIEDNQWTILTTRRVITQNEAEFFDSRIIDLKTKNSRNFKGFGNISFVKAKIELHNGLEIPYFIETGEPSMVMIYGIQTAMHIIPRGAEWIEKTEQRYKNRGLIK